MEQSKRKAINFDLDTNKMKELGLYPDGYRVLGKALNAHGFEHRQGSGYTSKDKLNSNQINDIVLSLITEYSWLVKCAKKVDVTDIGRQHDLTKIIKSFDAELDADNLPARDVSHNESKATRKELQPKDKEVMSRIRSSKMGAEFNKLYDGKYAGDKAAADKSLVNILSFFTNGDKAQIQRIYETSKLYEPSKGPGIINGVLSNEASFRSHLGKSAGASKNKSNYNGK